MENGPKLFHEPNQPEAPSVSPRINKESSGEAERPKIDGKVLEMLREDPASTITALFEYYNPSLGQLVRTASEKAEYMPQVAISPKLIVRVFSSAAEFGRELERLMANDPNSIGEKKGEGNQRLLNAIAALGGDIRSEEAKEKLGIRHRPNEVSRFEKIVRRIVGMPLKRPSSAQPKT